MPCGFASGIFSDAPGAHANGKVLKSHWLVRHAKALVLLLLADGLAAAQGGHQTPPAPPSGAKSTKCANRPVPQLEDVTAKAGITFKHASDPTKKYIVESMSGGVILLDYDRDGWLDIYFTNAPSVEMAVKGQKSRGALYHNNHDGTFADVTDKAGIATPCFAMGG
ncbi:MAG TPA: VCBS repeat-containing protein, partial [Candidatus Acidoferrum sp.]|nr:VCBS repeat-containing protein [Candidatus Acidoferrum sp.]